MSCGVYRPPDVGRRTANARSLCDLARGSSTIPRVVLLLVDGTLRWTSAHAPGTLGYWAAAVQADDDPEGEVVFIGESWVLFDTDGALLVDVAFDAAVRKPGPPCMADLDDDGRGEIALALRSALTLRDGEDLPQPRRMWRVAATSRRSASRKSGWAMPMSSSARCRRFLPCRFTAPYSVTTQWTCPRVVTTPAPGLSSATIREHRPPAAVEGRAMIGLPPLDSAAPRMKSICPPMPE